jgi:hypothetical protein
MKFIHKGIALLALSAPLAVAGCMAGQEEGQQASAGDPAVEASADEALRAQCSWGWLWVPELNFCAAPGSIVDRSYGAFGCTYGGVRSGWGNIQCFTGPGGGWPPPGPPIVGAPRRP